MDIRVKKRHTLKSQIDQETKEIICTAHDKGKEHDLVQNQQSETEKEITCLGDKGWRNFILIVVTKKKPRGSDLSAQDKKNRELARLRVVGERVNRMLKIFRFCQNFIGIGGDLG